MKLFRFLLLFAAFLGISSVAVAQAPVTLRPTAEIHRGAIRLSDVFDGVSSEKDQDIALAPAPGKNVIYNVKVLAQLSEQFSLGWMPESLADRCVLTRAATWIRPDMVGAKIVARIQDVDSKDLTDIAVLFDNRFTGIALPADQEPAFDLQAFEYDPQTRRFKAELIAGAEASSMSRQKLSGRVAIQREVPVPLRRLQAGTTVGARDLVWQKIPQEKLPTDAVTDIDEIVGREVRRDQLDGDVFRARDLMPPRLVTRGSLVTMKVESPMMQITVQGRALQDGAKGEVVRVTNLQSNRTIEGTVEASGVVRVGTARKLASAE